MEKLTKENIYIDLRGKSKEELTELYNFLKNVGEKPYRETLNDFLETNTNYRCLHLYYGLWRGYDNDKVGEKTEVTIEQLKEILKPKEMTRNQELREEAKERGYTHDNFKCLKDLKHSSNPNLDKWYYEGCTDTLYSNSCGNGGKVVYKDGVWAKIIKPMETFTPTAMKCTQEQFDAVKPKLINKIEIYSVTSFNSYPYLTNTDSSKNRISNISEGWVKCMEYIIHEEWNEEIFLKACGIEVDTLEQQLEKAEAEVKRLKEAIEDSKIKVGDWVVINETDTIFKVKENDFKFIDNRHKKITDQELINKLNELIK